MKTIGLIGGMSWESSVEYYRLINQEVRRRMGGHHSAKMMLWSVDFAEIEKCQRESRWDDAAKILSHAAKSLENSGANCIILATNTMHKVAPEIEQAIQIPFLHIADVVAAALQQSKIDKVALLGTRFTMEQRFYVERLETKF